MVELAAEAVPHARHRLGRAVGPGEILVSGEHSAKQQRARGSSPAVVGHDQVRTAHPLEHQIVESHSPHLGADEPHDGAIAVHGHQRRKVWTGPSLVD